MKRRFYGLLSMGVCIAALGAVIGYGVYLAGDMKTKGRIKAFKLPEEVTIPDETVMEQVDELYSKLYGLTVLEDDQAGIALGCFGYKPPEQSYTPGRSAGPRSAHFHSQDPEESFSYSLTLAFASNKKRFCMIDGKLYANHQTLPDKAKIIAIEHDRVLVRKNKMAKWIYLEQEALPPEGNADTPSQSVHKTRKEKV